MAVFKKFSIAALYVSVWLCCVTSDEPPPETVDDSDAPMNDPMMYSDKRQHSIMRFGKRPSGHSFVRFGKRGDGSKSPQHSYLSFGKRSEPQDILELLEYLRRNQDNSWKRGHNIMRFGKRADSHHFIRFGRSGYDDNGPDNEEASEEGNIDEDIEEPKRDGHSMLYFGKRNPVHSMMYFGKRGGHSMMYFGKRQPYSENQIDDEYPAENNMSEDKRSPHSMMYFGKRGHSMLYFGKRQPDSEGSSMDEYPTEGNMSEDKRSPHSMLYFGKRLDDNEDKRAHQMIHFGKRFDDDSLDDGIKRAHSMIHFGKRDFDEDPNEDKRGSHSMIHFGKRNSGDYDYNEDLANLWTHKIGPIEANSKRYHSLMRFGKKTDGMQRGGSHSMIHFGKKAAHSMIHFGKRSVNEYEKLNTDASDATENKVKASASDDKAINDGNSESSPKDKSNKRKKRDIEAALPALSLIPYMPNFDSADIDSPQYTDTAETGDSASYPEALVGTIEDYNGRIPIYLSRQIRSDDFHTPKEKSSNVFLRFG